MLRAEVAPTDLAFDNFTQNCLVFFSTHCVFLLCQRDNSLVSLLFDLFDEIILSLIKLAQIF